MTVVLHHYPESLYSEKIRLLLGFYRVPWRSVIISNIMPRPLLMPLSGGYRRTPVLQIDANVYCDSRIIARGLARHVGDWRLHEPPFSTQRLADWADTRLFQISVAMNFRPEAISAMLGGISAEDAAAFQQDRAELASGGSIATMSAEAAAAELAATLIELDRQLTGSNFLFGKTPTIADFSVYHCLWFLRNNSVNAVLLEPFGRVRDWMARMEEPGHGEVSSMSAEQALAVARDSEPVAPSDGDQQLPGVLTPGAEVAVTPADYGRVPVSGRLVSASAFETVVLREDESAGRVMNHFPTTGFDVTAAS